MGFAGPSLRMRAGAGKRSSSRSRIGGVPYPLTLKFEHFLSCVCRCLFVGLSEVFSVEWLGTAVEAEFSYVTVGLSLLLFSAVSFLLLS